MGMNDPHGTTPPADANQNPPASAAAPPAKTTEQLLAEIASLKSEAAQSRIENRDLKTKVSKFEEEKSELEKARLAEEGKWKERAELEKAEKEKLKQQMIQNQKTAEVRAALSEAGVINPLVTKLVLQDKLSEKIVVTEDGEVQGISDVVKAFKETHPDFFKPASPPANNPATPPVTQTGTDKQPPAPGLPGKPGSVSDLPPQDYEAAKMKAIYG